MNLPFCKRLLLLPVFATLLTLLASGQATTGPIVSADSVDPGEFRPFSWVMLPGDGRLAGFVPAPGQAACNKSNPCYYTPSQLSTAYGLPPILNRGNGGQGITIAIVVAYYDPQIASNLAYYSSFFGLPYTTFAAVNQSGGPAATVAFNSDWAFEANLDVQQAHATAPLANLLLVAAASSSSSDIFAALQYAAAHADIVSNSYGMPEDPSELRLDGILAGFKVPVLFASGDVGGAGEYPCVSPYVVCVGGTTLLTTSSGFRTSESAWYDGRQGGGTGGGCSTFEVMPSYQTGFSEKNCRAMRSVPDIAALADPTSGVPVALGTNVMASAGNQPIYCCVGGTSLSVPLVAGVLANVDAARVSVGKAKLGSNLNALLYKAASYTPSGTSNQPAPYGNSYRSFYFDVFSGGTIFPATTYLDLTTGLGVPSFSALGNYLTTQAP